MIETASSPKSHENEIKIGPTRLLIDGEFRDSVSGKTFETISPATEEPIAEVAEADAADVDLAVRAARKALEEGPWARMDPRERGKILLRWADLIESQLEELARLESLDCGKAIQESLSYDVPGTAAVLRYFGGWADKLHGKTIPASSDFFMYTRREPVGVCGQIIPWNFPMSMAAWKVGPALAAGCTSVLKPAEQTPLTALRMAELAMQAGLPPGVLNVLPGFGPTAGGAIVEHPGVDKIAFTGEYTTAQTIKRRIADTMKRATFELGGKSPNVIFADSDLDEAVEGAYGAIFLNQGQNCCAGSRAFVQEEVYDTFVDKLAERAKSARLGDPLDENTEHGALIDQAQFDKTMRYVAAGRSEGAECVAGGEREFERGYFVRPTVFAGVEDSMSVATEEIFGPVVSVLRFKDVDEVIERANDTPYGLAAAVWTRDIGKAHAVAEGVKAGTVWVNCYNIVDPAAPFGGYKMSGMGRELGEQAFDAYTETKTVTILKGQA
ncbi:MAG: aldehyde dehydrogenase family protein [Myxococcales bacterium]|jgi:aldehyde dehydrogenase (NAD+)